MGWPTNFAEYKEQNERSKKDATNRFSYANLALLDKPSYQYVAAKVWSNNEGYLA